MADQPDELVVCMSVASGPPGVPSYVDVCSSCSVDVWRSNRSSGYPSPSVCLRCFVSAIGATVADGVIVRPAPWVAQDLADG